MAGKKKGTGSKNLRQETGIAPVTGHNPDDLLEFFGDGVRDPNTGEMLERPVQLGDVILGPDNNEILVTEENIHQFGGERPTPEYSVGDRDLDAATGEIREVHAIDEKGNITWGPLTGGTKDDGTPTGTPENTPASAGDGTPAEGDPQPGTGQPATVEQLQQKLQAMESLVDKIVPERLRKDRTAEEALEQLGTSYTEAEKKISEQGGAINRYREIMGGQDPDAATPGGPGPVPTYNQPVRPAANPNPGAPLPKFPSEGELAEISDEDFTYKPRETNEKLVLGMMAKMGPVLAQGIVDQVEGRQVASFRLANPEWDQLWQEGLIQEILKTSRGLDSPTAMPETLRRAKLLKEQRVEEQKATMMKEAGIDPAANQQQAELVENLTNEIKTLQTELKGIKEGIPEAVEKVHAEKVKNMNAFTPQPAASGGGAAAVKQETEERKQQQPTMSPEDAEFEAIRNATPRGREALHNDPQNAAILNMMKGKIYDEESGEWH